MTIAKGIDAGTRVTLSLRDYLAQACVIVTVVGSVVWWGSVKFAEQREADTKQNERISSVEADVKRHANEAESLAATLSKLADKIELLQSTTAEIRTGVARIDERTRGK